MIRDYLTAAVVVGAVIQVTAAITPPAQPPANQTAATAPPAGTDPAVVSFTSESGMVLHAIKPQSVADYEAAIVALQQALSNADDDDVKQVARAWRVLKAAEPDAKGSVIYVHLLEPTTADVDYRPSIWLDQLLAGAPADLLAQYRDAFAVAPSKLSLTEFARMSEPPKPSNATPAKPANGSPR